MLQLRPHSRIFLATEPVDFRQGIDGLAAVCRQVLGANLLEGAVYVFRNRAATALKLLLYDGQGYWLCLSAYRRDASRGGLRPRTPGSPCPLVSASLSCGMATPIRPTWHRIGDAWLKAGQASLERSRATTPPGSHTPRRDAPATPPSTPGH